MLPWQWIALGVMLTLTPSLVVLGVLLHNADNDENNNHDNHHTQ